MYVYNMLKRIQSDCDIKCRNYLIIREIYEEIFKLVTRKTFTAVKCNTWYFNISKKPEYSKSESSLKYPL